MERTSLLRARQASAEEAEEAELPASNLSGEMRLAKRWGSQRRVLVWGGLLGSLLLLLMVSMTQFQWHIDTVQEWHVSPTHRKLVQDYVLKVLDGQCRLDGARKLLLTRLPTSSHVSQPFLWKNMPYPDDVFTYAPPFGFRGLEENLHTLLQQLPKLDKVTQPGRTSEKCQRCVVIGNGGILKGLELGALIDHFDTIIRLNSGPLGEYSIDVGNRTSIRMSYPEGTPLNWMDTDAHALFVAVVYKGVDISWTAAMVNKQPVPWKDWFFFWKKVAAQIPIDTSRFRLLNPLVIREAALGLLKYPPPSARLWGWDQNVPTIGITAVNLASLLCDEVSIAGFGYNHSQQGAPLHYYDHQPMSAMLQEKMHNVDRETELLRSLVNDGVITDLTGGIHCYYCTR
ncbi:lactosylceramide alpha-2,3-sialyltransferase isoform X1 [Synchiropus splendidus]|uniref:lactosylceramide alpha-2,3-sialyltransferase isoform X1 n=2 Tax=Synchiropus splendidus TaxID=270530 RepID=UPI00237EBBC5|nr:lactosylceramide alpha-2,3-sialyltransferase isoform X1 [Synchiropus splendidus]